MNAHLSVDLSAYEVEKLLIDRFYLFHLYISGTKAAMFGQRGSGPFVFS